MKSYQSIDEMWTDLLVQLTVGGSSNGSRAGGTSEIFGWSARLVDPLATAVTSKVRGWSPSYAAAELLWYFGLKRETEMIKAYAPSYSKYENGGMAMGQYGWRWANNPGFAKVRKSGAELAGWHQSQIHAAARLLREKPDTRQAVVTMWDSGDVVEAIRGEWRDVPCTVAMQFRAGGDGRLNAMTFMRSNDAWLGFPYDAFCFCGVLRAVAASANMRVGEYVHAVGSMHLYDRDRERAIEVIEEGAPASRDPVDASQFSSTIQQMQEAAKVEALGRSLARRIPAGGKLDPATVTSEERSWMGNVKALDCHAIDLARLCWRKLLGREASDALVGPVRSDVLRELADRKEG